jgi:putative membrane protein
MNSPLDTSAGRYAFRALLVAYGVMWAGGIGHYVLVGKPPLDAPWAASLFLLLAGMIVFITASGRERRALAAAAAIGFLAEIIGVRYGFLFSPYSYTRVLIPHLLDVPLVMLSAWMVLVAYTSQLAERFALSRPVRAIAGALWMTSIDLVIDPLAANQLGYWRWVETGVFYGVPFHNFVGWFLVSLLIFLVIPAPERSSPLALHVGLSIVIFFTAIALSLHVWLAGGIGLILVLIDLLVRLRRTGSVSPA